MSRIGKRQLIVPEKVSVHVEDQRVTVEGPGGKLAHTFPSYVSVVVKERNVQIAIADNFVKRQRSMWGTANALVRNMILGVSEGFMKRLQIKGVGYAWSIAGKTMTVKAGYSHVVTMTIPEGITVSIEDGNVLQLRGADKQQVGEFAAQIRRIRKPEPYKGKGIMLEGEVIRRKAGKQAAGATG